MPYFTSDLAQAPRPFPHVWEAVIGSGHAPLALRADWQRQLQRCHTDLGVQRVRFHGLLSKPMGTLICQNEQLLYSFFNADQIMDFLLSINMRPFVELSFMPDTLASGNQTVFRYQANITPPKDMHEWATLIHKLVAHWADRYGKQELRTWQFEVWNEPNLKAFWTGTQQQYFELYRHTAQAIKAVDADIPVGGPATAQNAWVEEFVDYCQHAGVPADFVSTHYYPTDAFGKIGADTRTQLAHVSRDVMRDRAARARSQAGGRPVYYTEWSTSSNPRDPLHDQPFAAAFATRILMSVYDLVDGYSFWTFSDIFEENYMPSVLFHGGFGLLNLHGVPKPVYRAFELLHGTGDRLFGVQGQHETVDAWVIGAGRQLTVLLINLAMPDHAITTEQVHIRLEHAGAPQAAVLTRIDEQHANPRRAWVEMGEPMNLSPQQVEQLHTAARLAREPVEYTYADQHIDLNVTLPPQALAAITVELGQALPAAEERAHGN
jgi:xylan 1,4-beta-xylosidase